METDSIFKGLNLSAQATNTELGKSDSPYLRRAQRGMFIIMTKGLLSRVKWRTCGYFVHGGSKLIACVAPSALVIT